MHVLFIYPAGMEYTTVITTLTFSVSTPTQVVTIPILDDGICESSKSFNVTLTTSDPAVTLSIQTATVTISDNDSKLWAVYYYCMYSYAAYDIHATPSLFHVHFPNCYSRGYNWI